MERVDLRIQKTRMALKNALYELLCEMSLDAVTVTNLCQRAMIRKATFYMHFRDKEELLVYVIQDMRKTYQDQERGELLYDPEKPTKYYIEIFEYLLEYIEKHEKFARSVLNSNSCSKVMDMVADIIAEKTGNKMYAVMYTGAIVNLVKWWITQPKRMDRDAMTQEILKILQR